MEVNEEKTPQPQTTEGKGESAQEPQPVVDVEAITKQLEQTQKELESTREEAKAHQRNVSKKAEEYNRFESRISSLDKRLEVVTQMLADVVDRTPVEEEPPRRKRSEEYLSRLKGEETPKQEKQIDESLHRAALEADTLAKSAGLEMDKSPELKDAYISFLRGDGESGLEEVRKVVNTHKETKENKSVEERIKKEVDERVRKVMEERGLLVSDGVVPAAGAMTRNDAAKAYAEGRISREEYEKFR